MTQRRSSGTPEHPGRGRVDVRTPEPAGHQGRTGQQHRQERPTDTGRPQEANAEPRAAKQLQPPARRPWRDPLYPEARRDSGQLSGPVRGGAGRGPQRPERNAENPGYLQRVVRTVTTKTFSQKIKAERMHLGDRTWQPRPRPRGRHRRGPRSPARGLLDRRRVSPHLFIFPRRLFRAG